MTTELSTEIKTHEIHYKMGGKYESVKVTQQEATTATLAWKAKEPVPIPNKKDKNRSCMIMKGLNIEVIKRFRYID